MMRILLVFSCIAVISACSYVKEVFPDKRDEYKKSESLPDLEVPPDLTAEGINKSMSIPGGSSPTLSEYNQRRSNQYGNTAATTSTAQSGADGQWLSVSGSASEIWPKLRIFFIDKGYDLDLDDAELGVLVTSWTDPANEGGGIYRNKFKVFSEAGSEPGNIILYISSTREEQVSRDDGSTDWIDQGSNINAAKQLIGELNIYLSGRQKSEDSSLADTGSTSTATSAAVSRKKAEMLNAGEGRMYLTLPEEYTRAWRNTEVALERAGLLIDDKDQSKGLYAITYFDSEGTRKKGWISKLAFWKGDGSEGKTYQISLTGVGDKTELLVLNKDGGWETNNDAGKILALIQDQFNQ